jgi:hypothetical protein
MQGRLDEVFYMPCLVVVELAVKLCKTKRHYYIRQTPFFPEASLDSSKSAWVAQSGKSKKQTPFQDGKKSNHHCKSN